MCAAMLNARLHVFVKAFSRKFNEARGKMFLGKAYNLKQASCWLISHWNSCYSHIRTARGTHSECFFSTVNLFTNSQVFVNHVSLLGLSTVDIWRVVLLDGNVGRSGRLVLVWKRRASSFRCSGKTGGVTTNKRRSNKPVYWRKSSECLWIGLCKVLHKITGCFWRMYPSCPHGHRSILL